ncbi:fungal-specific transcription factor domain-containing protein [Lentinula boryana]|uniref:Fungal-specific transcription factor domain-containing protein n=1 Tax=Lentinula boryana TaxID=40481 RepID=A0ABQ8QSN5_9AGAR|nr:fungal-specific transcription factor domain-containing protein [Lentinula boryana]
MSLKNENFLHSFPQMSTKEMHDLKRVRGQISCAECRRLKLKCDKKIPCSSCVRRGCKSVCPTETSLAQGKRSAESAGLLKQVEIMSQRIQELEDAMSTLQSSVSFKMHPLHQTSSEINSERTRPHEEMKHTVDALGTLSLDKRGDARYLGPSAGLESLLEGGPELKEAEATLDEDEYLPLSSDEIAQLPKYFPLTSENKWDVESSMDMILAYFPHKERAWNLAEIFTEHSLLQAKVVLREELFDEMLTPLYQYTSTMDFSGQKCPLSPTRLAVLLICFAHGSLADIGQPMYSPESEDYLSLSRICLALHPVLSSPDLASVQALTLTGMFHNIGGRSYNIEAAWSFLTIAAKLSQSLGLHRESPMWGLDQKTLHRRRMIFWEILTWDAILSLALGRPPCFFGAHIDTPLPVDEDASVDEDGNMEPGFHQWRMSFSRDVVTAVSDITLSSRMPNYATILDLDRRVQQHPLPKKFDPLWLLHSALEKNTLNALDDRREEQLDYKCSSVYLKGHHLSHWRAIVTIYIHRAFFAQALLQSPSNPMNSVYAPSFLATYRAASTVVHLNVKHFYKYFEILSRFWALWNGILMAGIILGLIVTRCPKSTLAANAYEELTLVVDLFKMGATNSDGAKRGLYVLLQTYGKATKAFQSQDNSEREELNVAQEDVDALHTLEMFAGYTKLLMKDMASNSKVFSHTDAGSPTDLGESKQEFEGYSTLPISMPSGTVSPTVSSYRSEETDPRNSSEMEISYPVVPTREISHHQHPSHHVQPVDQRYSDQALHSFASPLPNMPTVYPFERQGGDSSRMTSQDSYHVDSYHVPSQYNEHWPQYDPSTYHDPKREDLNLPGASPDPQSVLQRPGAGFYTSEHLLTTAVGALNVQWAELMQNEGVYFPAAGASRGYQ